MYTVGKFNVSKIAVSHSVILILMFICQRTFLKKFHPGAANWSETIGVLVVALTVLLISLFEVRDNSNNKE